MNKTKTQKKRRPLKKDVPAAEEKIILRALACLENRLRYSTKHSLRCSKDVCTYLRLQLASEQDEVFAVLFLNHNHNMIAFEKLFYGTINEASVYPRKILKKALEHNASKLIIAHNHPSQNCCPSEEDKKFTCGLSRILKIIDVMLIDHIIVAHHAAYSFAEHGLL
jgi:DNA repair protein RadC